MFAVKIGKSPSVWKPVSGRRFFVASASLGGLAIVVGCPRIRGSGWRTLPSITRLAMQRQGLMVAVGVLTFLGACFAAFVANVWRWADCCSESGLEASPGADAQFVVALVGIVPAFGTLVQSLRGRGRPWLWFYATAIVYAVWGVLVVVWAV
jgi:uncharacterized protein (DUF983 family)